MATTQTALEALHVESTQNGAADLSRRPEIEALAYQLWQDRGRPEGSPEVDWLEAERMLEETGNES